MRRLNALVKRILPPQGTIHLIGLRNYLLGEAEIRVLKYLVDPARDSIDIGCDRGAYAYFLKRLSRRVICFEPLPASADFLESAFSGASNVSVCRCAVSNEDMKVTLWVPTDRKVMRLNSSMVGPSDKNCDKSWIPIQVLAKRLDSLVEHSVGFVKIDVEGHESEVLQGAEVLLRDSRPNLVIEIEKRHAGKEPREVFESILRLDYRGWFLWRRTIHSIDQFESGVHQQIEHLGDSTAYVNNFIFTPREFTGFPPHSWAMQSGA